MKEDIYSEQEKSRALSMESWVEQMIRKGNLEIVKMMIKTLSEENKLKYRELYKRIMKEKEEKEEK